MTHRPSARAHPLARLEGVEKVTGAARYAVEQRRRPCGVRLAGASRRSRTGSVTAVDADAALGRARRARRALRTERARGWSEAGDGELLRPAVPDGRLPRPVSSRLVVAESLEHGPGGRGCASA